MRRYYAEKRAAQGMPVIRHSGRCEGCERSLKAPLRYHPECKREKNLTRHRLYHRRVRKKRLQG